MIHLHDKYVETVIALYATILNKLIQDIKL